MYSFNMTLSKLIITLALQMVLIVRPSQADTTQNLTQLLSDFVLICGSSAGFCNQPQSPLQIEPTVTPNCAQSMRCYPNCVFKNDCAPDAEFAFIDISCVGADVYPLKVETSTRSFDMITQCGIVSPNNNARRTVEHDLCSEFDLPEKTMNNLHDDVFRPVIARGSLITYRNIHCARCNDEDNADIVPFELEVKCNDKFGINSFNSLHEAWDAFYENNCSVAYKPPDGFIDDVRECPKQENMITRCNTTGLWSIEEYDPQIEWACEHFKSRIYKEHYRNIYCYMCNPSLVSKYNTELISSCNASGEIDFLDETVENGCSALPVMPRMSPFKNAFCKTCGGVLTKIYFDSRYFKDVNLDVRIRSVYDQTPLNPAGNVYTMFRFPTFYSTATISEIPNEHTDEVKVGHFIDALSELGTFCGYENMCGQPFKKELRPKMCNLPCVENSNCCRLLASGIDPGLVIATDLSYSFAELDTMYNQTEMINNKTSRMYKRLPVIATCDKETVIRNNISTTFQMKCEKLTHGDSLEYIPVTSKRVDYRNVYCARCNGEVGTLSAYDFQTECGTVLEAEEALSFADINEIIRAENCKIKMAMPNNKCESDVECVDTCPPNDSDSDYREDMKYLCESASLMINLFGHIEINNTMYKNVFCYFCSVRWNVSIGNKTFDQCNVTGQWDNTHDVSTKRLQCETMSFHPAWFSLGYKNIFCAECNMKMEIFFRYFDGYIECKGVACMFLFSSYRRAFFISISSPGRHVTDGKVDSGSADFCDVGKTMVNDTCRPIIENTVDLGYRLNFELHLDKSTLVFKKKIDVSILTMLETVRQQVKEKIHTSQPEVLEFSSVTVSTSGPCENILANENVTTLNIENTTSGFVIIFQADTAVASTKNRSRLENDLMNLRNNWTYSILFETGVIKFRSHPYASTPECLDSDTNQESNGCTISESSKSVFSEITRLITVDKQLKCVLQKLPSHNNIIVEELCSKGIPFHFDKERAGLVACKSDILQLSYSTVKSTPAVRHSVTTLSVAHAIFSLSCTCFSLLCLIITFVTYSLFESIRTLPGLNNMNLTITLFGAQLFTQFGLWLTEHEGMCIMVGIVSHYFWLCTFCAMNVCSFHMFKVFTSVMYTSQHQSKWVIVKYCLYVYVIPVLVILTYIVVKVFVDGSQHLGYGGSVCFLSDLIPIVAVLISPAVAIIIANFVFSFLAYMRIRCSPHVQSTLDRNDFKIYVKLLTVTGVAWPLIFIDSILPLSAFSFIATFANALQGVFIFCAFICNKKILDLYKNLCDKGKPYSMTGDGQKISKQEDVM